MKEPFREVLDYYVWYIPREVAWWAERALRLTLCRVRGHRWMTPLPGAGGAGFAGGSAIITYGADERWCCGRCGKQGGLLSEVTFTAKTYDPYGIW